jgi:hypothetical protein
MIALTVAVPAGNPCCMRQLLALPARRQLFRADGLAGV